MSVLFLKLLSRLRDGTNTPGRLRPETTGTSDVGGNERGSEWYQVDVTGTSDQHLFGRGLCSRTVTTTENLTRRWSRRVRMEEEYEVPN